MACQHSPDDQTQRLQAGAGEDNVIHLPSGVDCVDCERQEEEEDHTAANQSLKLCLQGRKSVLVGSLRTLSDPEKNWSSASVYPVRCGRLYVSTMQLDPPDLILFHTNKLYSVAYPQDRKGQQSDKDPT